jgi:DNA polymerase I
MDFELYPTIVLRPRSFNALLAPKEMFVQALNRNLNLQRFKVLYVAGNYSAVLNKLDRKFVDLEIRRGFIVFQLMTILEEANHSLIIVEHDPMLYEYAQMMIEYVFQAMRKASKDAAVLLYASGADPFFEEIVKNADRIFYFEEVRELRQDLWQRLVHMSRKTRQRWKCSHEVALEAATDRQGNSTFYFSVTSHGPKSREREYGRKGCLCQMAEDEQSLEERRPGLRAKVG